MSVETVRSYLAPFGVADKIRELPASSATVDLAAAALGTEGCRIAKTLSFHIGEEVAVIVVAGDAKIDNKKYKYRFSTKAKMLSFEEVEPLTGHPVGGVCPFALPEGVKVYLDESLRRFETVFPAAGSGNSAIELSIGELVRVTGNPEWVDVTVLPL